MAANFSVVWILSAHLLALTPPAGVHGPAGVPPSQGGISVTHIELKELPKVGVRFRVTSETTSIQGLKSTDLRVVLDDTVEVPFTFTSRFLNGEALSVALAIDLSRSMAPAMQALRAALTEFVERLGEHDQVALVTFKSTVSVEVPLGRNRDNVLSRVEAMGASGSTAFYDAVAEAAALLAASGSPRRYVVALTDGQDTSSRLSSGGTAHRIRESGASLVAIALGPGVDTTALRSFAESTGGWMVLASDPEDLLQAYRTIARDLEAEYYLTFTLPGGADRSWHTISIGPSARAPATIRTLEATRKSFIATLGPGIEWSPRPIQRPHLRAFLWGSGIFAGSLMALLAGLVAQARRNRARVQKSHVGFAVALALFVGCCSWLLVLFHGPLHGR